MGTKTIQLYDGDGFEIPASGGIIKFACCDCGLVHNFALAVEENGKIGFVQERNNRSTGQRRRWMEAARSVLHAKNSSKKEKTKRGSALTQKQ